MNKKYLSIIGVAVVGIIGTILLTQNKQPSVTPSAYVRTDVSGLSEVKPVEIVDLKNGDTYDLTASYVKKNINGTDYAMLAYNGSIPGPLIKVKQGSEVTINFKNETNMKTLLHSHGVRMDNAFDGSQVTQEEMKPGEVFAYKLKFPDPGVYWYHPHVREDYQQELGLYGNFLVEPDDPGYWSPVNREETLMLDDILIENGTVAEFDTNTADHTLMGRFGNVMLVNGEKDYQLEVGASQIVRLFLTNAANTRTFNLIIPGVTLKLVGGDNGKYEREMFVDSVILSPSERAVVEAYFAEPGAYRLEHRTPERSYQLAHISAVAMPGGLDPALGERAAQLRTNADIVSSIDPLRPFFDAPANKFLKLVVNMKSPVGMQGSNQHMMHGGQMMQNSMMQMGESKPIEWEDDMGMMNRDSTTETLTWQMVDEQTGKANMKIDDWKFKVGDKVKIKIFNDPKAMHPMQHPIHIHGQRFLVLSTNGVKNDNPVWKDTALVKTGDTVEFLIEMSNPGTWMIHCHISEHLEAGMMMKIEVDET